MAATKRGGRPTTFGDTAMVGSFSMRLNDEQAAAVSEFCERRGCSLLALARESVLAAAGLGKLGRGVEAVFGQQRQGFAARAVSVSVPVTQRQQDALRKYARGKGVDLGAIARESVLRAAGARHLGAIAELERLRDAVGLTGSPG